MLSKTDMETLAVLGYTREVILRLVAAHMEQKGKSLLALISGMGPAERVPIKNLPRRKSKPPVKPPAKELPPKTPAPAKVLAKAAVKRTLTPEARANIIAAQKARWAAYHAEKGSAA